MQPQASASSIVMALLLLLLLGASCAGGSSETRSPPDRRAAPLAVLRSASPGSSVYDDRQPVEVAGLASQLLAIIERVALTAGQALPEVDQATQGAVKEIARGLIPGQPPPSALVEFAMRRYGLIDPPPHFVIASLPEDNEQSLLDQLAQRLPRVMEQASYRRVGIAIDRPLQAPAERMLVVAFFESRIQLTPPLPRRLSRGQTVAFTVRLTSDHRELSLVVTDPKGRTTSSPLALSGSRYSGNISCREPGVLQVEVTGAGPVGTEVLANFPCYCAIHPPAEVHYAVAVEAFLAPEEMARLIYQKTNAERRQVGLPALAASSALDRVARQHSQHMLEAGFVGHVSPVSGSTPADRIRQAGIVHLVARENVARAYSPDEVVRELMRSPAHRSNILATDVTDLGVGVVVDSQSQVPVLLVTQNFIKPGIAYDPKRAPEDLLHLVQRARRSAGLAALALDGQLSSLALSYLQAIASGSSNEQADEALSAELKRLGARYQRVEGVLLRLSVLDGVAQAKEALKGRTTHLGIGVQLIDDQLNVFLLLAEAR